MNIKNYFSFKLITSFVGAMMFLSPFAVSANTITPREGKESIPIHANSIEKELSRAVNAKDFGYGKDATEKVGPRSVTPVAILKVFADSSGGSSGYVSGHAFITVKNVSGNLITVGRFSGIVNNKTVSIGTWGNKYEHTGLWYNLESYFVSNYSSWSNRKSASYILTTSDLSTLNSYIINNDYWSYLTNCSSFASDAWNAVVDTSYELSAGTPNTPQSLKNDIVSTFPSTYQTGASVPFDYAVYYTNGTGTPILSSVYN